MAIDMSGRESEQMRALVQVLDQMARCVGDLVSRREQGRRLLLTGTPAELLDLSAAMEEDVARLERLDRQRVSLETSLCRRPEQILDPGQGPGGAYAELHAASARLAAGLVAAARAGSGTGLLAHALLDWVDDRLAFIRRLDGAVATYAGNGAPTATPQGWQGSVDRRA